MQKAKAYAVAHFFEVCDLHPHDVRIYLRVWISLS